MALKTETVEFGLANSSGVEIANPDAALQQRYQLKPQGGTFGFQHVAALGGSTGQGEFGNAQLAGKKRPGALPAQRETWRAVELATRPIAVEQDVGGKEVEEVKRCRKNSEPYQRFKQRRAGHVMLFRP